MFLGDFFFVSLSLCIFHQNTNISQTLGVFFFSLHCFSSFSAVQIWMQSNRDAGGGLLGADESRQTEEEKGGGGRGEREGASIPSLSQILPPSDHESQP